MTGDAGINVVALRRQIEAAFSLDELRTLCFDLSIDHEALPGQTRSALSRELVEYCRRRGRLAELARACQALRPNVPWGEALAPPPGETAEQERRSVLVDLSRGQGDWDRFAAFARNPANGFGVIEAGLVEQAELLRRAPVLIEALPRRRLYTQEEIDLVAEWVWGGGGVLLLGNYAPIHHECAPNQLASRFGLLFEETLVMPEDRLENSYCRQQPRSFRPELAVKAAPEPDAGHPALAGVHEVVLLSACSLRITADPDGSAAVLLRSPASAGVMRPVGPIDPPHGFMPLIDHWELDGRGPAALVVATRHGKGRVAACGAQKLCTLEYGDNQRLLGNLLGWLARTG
jgi:hypothetical protein